MTYISNKNAVLLALKLCKHEFCVGVGVLGVAEVVPITPINKDKKAPTRGNLKKSIVSDVMAGDAGVYIGVNETAPYGIDVEKGTSRQKAQPYLEPGVMNAIPKIAKVAEALYKSRMGGK